MKETTVEPSSRSRILGYLSAAAYLLFVFWLYFPALFLYFDTDDWVFLKFARSIPWQEPWRYFSPETIWFYRPLQVFQFGITYQLAGFNEVWYNAQTLIMMFVSWGCFYWLVNELFGKRLAILSLVLLSVSPIAPDVLTWKSNFNTLHYAIVAILAAVCFTRYLRSASMKWYMATVGLAVAGWFTKESIVNLPFILLTVWVTCFLQYRWESREYGRVRAGLADEKSRWPLKAIFWDLLPFAVLTLVYGGLHLWLFENADPNMDVKTTMTSPVSAVGNLLSMVSYGLFGFLYDPLLLWQSTTVARSVEFIVRKSMVLAIIAFIAAWRWKSLPMLFSIAFVASSCIPVFLLEMYWLARYFYLAAAGSSVFLAALIFRLSGSALATLATWRSMSLISARERIWLYVALVFFVWVFVSSVIRFQQHIGRFGLESDFLKQTFTFLQSEGKRLPERPLIIYDRLPLAYMRTGVGTREMTELATGRRDVLGFNRHIYLEFADYPQVKGRVHRYSVDILTTQPMLRRLEVPTTGTVGQRAAPVGIDTDGH